MKNRRTARFLQLKAVMVIVLMNVFISQSIAVAGELTEQVATKSLIEKLNGIQSMEADFEQWIVDGKQNALQHVTGNMWLQRPGQFRWDTDDPYPQQIVSDGDVLWIYDQDLEQATKKKLDKEVGNTPALLLSGDPEQISKRFTISGFEFDKTGEVRFDLVPKDKEAMFSLLRVHFHHDRLNDMFLKDSIGQTTRIEFKAKKINQSIAKSTFKLKLDDSVDVIEEL